MRPSHSDTAKWNLEQDVLSWALRPALVFSAEGQGAAEPVDQ